MVLFLADIRVRPLHPSLYAIHWNRPMAGYLFYAKSDNSIWRMALPSGEGEERLMFSHAVDDSPYAPGRKGIYVIRDASAGRKRNLVFLRLADGQTTTLAEISGSKSRR